MSDTLYPKDKVLRRFRLDDDKFLSLISETLLQDKPHYSDLEVEEIKKFVKDHPYTRDDLARRYKMDSSLFDRFSELGFIRDTFFFKETETDIFHSFAKLRRLGYKDEDCLKVLSEVGIPRDENLSENSLYIQLKELAGITELTERTIKFYEKENLIPPPRIYKNKRFYVRKIIKELELIRDMQNLGYKLNEIAALLQIIRTGDAAVKSEAVTQLLKELDMKKKIIKEIEIKVETL